ncbi:hypothetical protein [Catenulispora sp. GP43]|uniref:hypothetical protein n=1 Tax=Catenulispora sp. GP43 TaxID=3156263 RepID=UPI0035160CCC
MTKWLTLDGPPGLCTLCRGPVTCSAGESPVDGENSWFFEDLCRNCDYSLVQQGRRFIPAHTRELFLELTGRWRIRIDQGSDAGVPVLRCLRRVFRFSISEAQELRRKLLDAGLPGSRGEMEWLALELGALGVRTTVTQETVGTQTELPERRMPMAPSRVGGGTSESAVTVADPVERERVADYLAHAFCLVAGGYWIDPVTRDPRHRGGDGFLTDGTYFWSLAWATLLRRHGPPLAEDFVAHVRGLDYQPPTLSEREIAAVQAATGLEPPPDEY